MFYVFAILDLYFAICAIVEYLVINVLNFNSNWLKEVTQFNEKKEN